MALLAGASGVVKTALNQADQTRSWRCDGQKAQDIPVSAFL
jgi:hypothetical protein